jgi:hypothetical protein
MRPTEITTELHIICFEWSSCFCWSCFLLLLVFIQISWRSYRSLLVSTNGTMAINIPYTHSYICSMRLFFAELNPTTSATSWQFYVGIPGNHAPLIIAIPTPPPPLTMEEDYSDTVPNFVLLFQNQSIHFCYFAWPLGECHGDFWT